MKRALSALAVGAIIALLAACAGAYVAGDVGAHQDSTPGNAITPPP
jgi:hypothetical protein